MKHQKTQTGAVRETIEHTDDKGFPLRYDLVFSNEIGLRRLAATYGEGFQKYGADNWKAGFAESVLVNHAVEHLRKHLMKDTSEDHLSHAVWNLFTLMWVQEHKPELMDRTSE